MSGRTPPSGIVVPPVLVYPHVVERPRLERGWITASRLGAQLDHLLSEGHRFLAADQLLATIQEPPPQLGALALSFEHAGEEFIETVHPLLGARGIPSLLFVETARVGRRVAGGALGLRSPSFRLSWSELRGLMARGVAIGSRGHTGMDLTRVTPELAFGDLMRSWREIQKNLGVEPVALAYPQGRHSAELEELAARAGFTLGFISRADAPARSMLALPRLVVTWRDQPRSLAQRLRRMPAASEASG